MTHKFEYSVMPGTTSIYAPIVPVTFINGKYSINTFALVDSGADSAIMSTVLGQQLEIDWASLPQQTGYTSSGPFFFRTFEDLKAEIKYNDFLMNMNIIEGASPYKCILGRADLFRKADIKFMGYKNEFEITFRDLN